MSIGLKPPRRVDPGLWLECKTSMGLVAFSSNLLSNIYNPIYICGGSMKVGFSRILLYALGIVSIVAVLLANPSSLFIYPL